MNGKLLPAETVAVEVLNIIRPTVAIARYIAFAALALKDYPEYLNKLQQDDKLIEWFVQEVRRFYPFFPFLVALANENFKWEGIEFEKDRKVLLDLYATNHDENNWVDPERFWPERFENWDESPYNFIPQGGGDYHQNHRCPGEWITIDLMKIAVDMLVNKMKFSFPEQDTSISLKRIPAIPKSRIIISDVKKQFLPFNEKDDIFTLAGAMEDSVYFQEEVLNILLKNKKIAIGEKLRDFDAEWYLMVGGDGIAWIHRKTENVEDSYIIINKIDTANNRIMGEFEIRLKDARHGEDYYMNFKKGEFELPYEITDIY
jgi:hypothetical protein